MKKIKKLLALVLAVVVCLSFAPAVAWADDGDAQDDSTTEERTTVDWGNCGTPDAEDVNWVLYSDGTLVISGSGEMQNFTSSGADWVGFNGAAIKSIEIQEGVENIGNYAFRYLSGLETIYLPDSLIGIGDNAFSSCRALKDVYYAGTETSWNEVVLIGSGNDYLKNAEKHFADPAVKSFTQDFKLLRENDYENLENIIEVFHEYEALTSEQKSQIPEDWVNELTEKNTWALNWMEVDKVLTLFWNLPDNCTINDAETVAAARKAYDNLTADQKALIDEENYKYLTDAESQVAKAKSQQSTTGGTGGSGNTGGSGTGGSAVTSGSTSGITTSGTQTAKAKTVNPMTVKAKTVKIKFKTLQKKKQTVKAKKAFTIKNAKGAVSFKMVKYDKKAKKKIKISKAGKITVKKGLKKGTYKIKVAVTAAGDATYNAATKTVTVKIKVK